MYAILLLVILVRATNALECWQGTTIITTPGGTKGEMKLEKCPAGLLFTRCNKVSCSMDEDALKEFPGIPAGTKSVTTTAKGCLLPAAECEMPEEGDLNGVSFKTLKKYCKMSCCEGNACNGESDARNGEGNACNGEGNACNGEGNACNGESDAHNGESDARSGEGNACNGTLGLRSLGTVTAIMALFAVFFVRWN
uniref:Uncharacterized protein n=1 Tax=Globodera rostochiensis TaxID=31243 RepID=A0A914I283_GLORO